MMKHLYQYLIWMAIFSVAACSKEPAAQPNVQIGASTPLRVVVDVIPQTRNVVAGTSFSSGSRINIILQDVGVTTKYQGVSQSYEFQQRTASVPGTWGPATGQGLLISDPANVYAHYPAVLTASEASLSSDKKTLNVALPASRDFGDMNNSSTFDWFYMAVDKGTPATAKEIFICAADADYMTGQGTPVSTVIGETKATIISMTHLMAMVVVCVKRSASLANRPDVKRITISNTTAGTSPLKQGSFSVLTNIFSPNTIPAIYTRTMTGFPVDKVCYAMMVYPAQMIAGDVQMELVVDKTKFTIAMPLKTWLAGHVYLYNVEISTNEAQIQGVQMEEWPEWIDKPFELE